MRFLATTALVLVAAATLTAQSPPAGNSGSTATRARPIPDGTGAGQVRRHGQRLSRHEPAAAVYWNATEHRDRHLHRQGFVQVDRQSGHVNHYGRVRRKQSRRSDAVPCGISWSRRTAAGCWKRRDGDANAPTIARGDNAAIAKPGADGTSVNAPGSARQSRRHRLRRQRHRRAHHSEVR